MGSQHKVAGGWVGPGTKPLHQNAPTGCVASPTANVWACQQECEKPNCFYGNHGPYSRLIRRNSSRFSAAVRWSFDLPPSYERHKNSSYRRCFSERIVGKIVCKSGHSRVNFVDMFDFRTRLDRIATVIMIEFQLTVLKRRIKVSHQVTGLTAFTAGSNR